VLCLRCVQIVICILALTTGINVKTIQISGLFLCALAAHLGTGCSKTVLVNEPELHERWACDEDADEAMLRGDYETGIVLHQRFLEKEPENGLALYHLGFAFGQNEDHLRELSYYERAIALGFEEEGVFFNLGMAYGELNQTEKAIHAFKRTLEISPDSAQSHYGLALAYRKSSDGKLTEQECLKAIEIDPEHTDARFLLSTVYTDRGDPERATEQLHMILRIDPTDERARTLLEAIDQD
jgi:tetratricopeptide (TPR) repeat protein